MGASTSTESSKPTQSGKKTSATFDEVVSPTHMNIPAEIAKALVSIQGEVQAMGKTAKNDHFKNTYAPLDKVMDTALPLLTKNKLSLMQWPITVGAEHFLHSVLLHESGVSMQSDVKLLLTKQDPQGLGSALTYTRRQTVMAILGLSAQDEDDDGNKASGHMPPPTQEHLDEIASICKLLKFPEEEVDRKLRGLRTDDQAILALSDLDRIMQGRAAAIKARQASEKANKVTVDSSDDEVSADTEEQVAKRLQSVGFKDSATIKQFIFAVTKKPLIGNCKAPELRLLNEAMDRLDSGEEQLPADWIAERNNSQSPDTESA